MVGPLGFLKRIRATFGNSFVFLLFSVYLGLKGTVSQMAGSAQLPYFKKGLGVTGERYQSFGTVAATPWSMKAAIGLLSDTVPIFGYHKKYYVILVSILGTAAFAVLGFIPLSAPFAAFLLLLCNLQVATVDLLVEGKYAEKMVEHPDSGSDLVSLVWGLIHVGAFVGSIVAGPMADYFNPRYIFVVCLPLAAQVIFPVLRGALSDPLLPPEQRGVRMDKIRRHPHLVRLSIVMTIGALVVGISPLYPGAFVQATASLITSISLAVVGYLWLPRMLGNANLYMFLSSASYLSISGAIDYFFTANAKCLPNGPHFKYTYYLTWTSIAGSIAGIVGVSIFQTYLSRGPFRRAFWFTALLKVVASLFDIMIVKRINVKYGVQDKIAFMLGDAIIYTVAAMLDFMPAVTLTSKLCPKGLEASVYALLASYQNLGSNIARCLGVALIEMLQIKTDTCQFQQLPLAIFIAHVALPLCVVPLVFVLIPDAKMTDNLLEEDGDNGRTDPDQDGGGEWSASDTSDEETALTYVATSDRDPHPVEQAEQ